MTDPQYVTFRDDMAANTNTIPSGVGFDQYSGQQIKNLPHSDDAASAIAWWYSQLASPDYFVWNSSVPVNDIMDSITWGNYTPLDAADGTALWDNRVQLVIVQQTNLQLLLQGRTSFDATRKTLRTGLNNATTQLPTGTGGASRSGGWNTILPLLSRKCKRIEKLFAFDDGPGTGNTTTDPRGASTNPDGVGFEGSISSRDVTHAWEV